MRKLIIVFALLMAGGACSFAQAMLRVSLADKKVINVALDGRYFTKKGTSVTVGDLPAGNHYLQIYAMVQKRNGKLREMMIYEGDISINAGMITFFEYDPVHGGTIQEQDINSYVKDHPLPKDAAIPNNNSVSRDSNNGIDNNNDTNASVASPVAIETIGTLTDAKTDNLKTQVAAKKTDTDKMKVLKDGLKNETISTDQAAYMMDWLNFESSKIEFLKWAYKLTVDKENYNTLDSKFSYKNYQDEFTKFINEQR